MRKILIFVLLFTITTIVSAQEDPRSKATVYGCIKYHDTLFIKQTEVSIADWLGYIYSTYHEDAFGYDYVDVSKVKQLWPSEIDSSCNYLFDIFLRTWTEEWMDTKKPQWYRETLGVFPMCLYKNEKKDYQKIQLYLNKPITGLTYDQIYSYLNWYSRKLDSYLKEEDTYIHSANLLPVALYDQLINEHIDGLRTVLNKEGVHTVVGDSVNLKGCQLFNFKGSINCAANEARIAAYGTSDGSVSISSYHSDLNGFYNLLGNVAEMTDQEGIAKGGHYEMYAAETIKNNNLAYSEPSKLIGFRFMVKLIKN